MFKLRHEPPTTPLHRVINHALSFVHLHQERGLSANLEAAVGEEYRRLVALLGQHGYLDTARYPRFVPAQTFPADDAAHEAIVNAAFQLVHRILARVEHIHDVWLLIDSPDTYSVWLTVRGIRRNLADLGFRFDQPRLAA